MKRLMVGIGTTLMVALVAVVAWPTTAGAAALQSEGSGPAGGGKALFMDQKCNMCHDVSKAGITATTKSAKMKGPDLKGVEKDADWIAKYLKKEVDLDGAKHRKAFSGSEAELEVLVDWIKAQK